MYIYIYTRSPLPPGPSYFIDCFIVRSTGCYQLSAKRNKPKRHKHQKNRKEKNNALESLLPFPHTKAGLPKLCFFLLFFFGGFFLGTLSLPNPTQNKSSKMCVCLFFLVWGRGGELRI